MRGGAGRTAARPVGVGEQPVGTPQAAAVGAGGALVGRDARPVPQDQPAVAPDAAAVDERTAVGGDDAVGRVEGDRPVRAADAGRSVGGGAVRGGAPRAAVKDYVAGAREALGGVAAAAVGAAVLHVLRARPARPADSGEPLGTRNRAGGRFAVGAGRWLAAPRPERRGHARRAGGVGQAARAVCRAGPAGLALGEEGAGTLHGTVGDGLQHVVGLLRARRVRLEDGVVLACQTAGLRAERTGRAARDAGVVADAPGGLAADAEHPVDVAAARRRDADAADERRAAADQRGVAAELERCG